MPPTGLPQPLRNVFNPLHYIGTMFRSPGVSTWEVLVFANVPPKRRQGASGHLGCLLLAFHPAGSIG